MTPEGRLKHFIRPSEPCVTYALCIALQALRETPRKNPYRVKRADGVILGGRVY